MKPNNPHIPGPQSFIGPPSLSSYHPEGRGMVVHEVPAVKGPAKRTHQTEALVHVRLPDRVELNREALSRTGLNIAGAGFTASCADIIPPRKGVSNEWLLDTRPTVRCRLQAAAGSGRVFFKSQHHFPLWCFQPAPGVADRTPRSRLSFSLGAQILESVCVQVAATEYRAAHQVCEQRGTGVYRLVLR